MSESHKYQEFLLKDFEQSFQQLRHYDSQIIDLAKFTLTAYSIIIGSALGIYQFGLKEGIDFISSAIAILTIGFILGLFLFSILIRNRSNYVLMARYINALRGHYLALVSNDFCNMTRIYADHRKPLYFNWHSTQSWLIYFVTALNTGILAILLFINFRVSTYKWEVIIVSSVGVFISQLVVAVKYLRSLDVTKKGGE